MENREFLNLDCCCSEPPYTPEERLCCDEDGECRRFKQKCRDCFWPEFSHPTWLRCRILYCCCERRRHRCREDRD